jgi:hypothetical protein
MFYFVAIFMTIVLGLSPGRVGVQLIYFTPGMVCQFPYSKLVTEEYLGWWSVDCD